MASLQKTHKAHRKVHRLIWSTGEPYSQSSRFINETTNHHAIEEINKEKRPNQIQSDKINTSNDYTQQNDTLSQNKTFDDMEKVNNFIHPTTDLVRNKQRETFDFQIADREMFPQCGTNPFFTNSSYADQISMQSSMSMQAGGEPNNRQAGGEPNNRQAGGEPT